MRTPRKFALRVRSLFRAARLDAELDEELRYHLDRQIEMNRAAGMSADEARLAALRDFGGLQQRAEECREARGLRLLENAAQDLRYALRAISNSPGFATVAVLSLALGIGANTTIFSFVDAVLLRPLPYPESDRLVVLREQPSRSATTVNVHPQNFLEWRARARSFDALALVQTIPANVPGPDGAEQVVQVQTTSALFRAFGVAPMLGRAFSDEETRPGGPALAMLGYGFWQRRFGGDPNVIGRRLALADGVLTIIGVAPAGLRIGLVEPDLYAPLPIDPAHPDAIGARSFQCYGRLKAGIDLAAARSEMATIASALAKQYTMDEGYGVFVSTLHTYLVAESRPALRVLMGVVALVLLIACVNLAGLLLARGLGRRSELALRASLGATRGRLVSQLVIESLTLAAVGGLAGLIIACWATRMLLALVPATLTAAATEPVRLNWTSVLFTIALAAITAVVFGLVPAWQASRVEPQVSVGAQSRGGTADRRHQRLRSLLVVAQVALAVVLLVGAGLLLRTFAVLTHVDIGFKPGGTLTMRLFLGDRPAAERIALVDRILERVESVPGVRAASTIQFLPLSGMNCGTGFWREGDTPGDAARSLPTNCSLVSRGFFRAMGIPILEGRGFDVRDRSDAPPVVIVNEAFARRYFPGRRAVGRRVMVAGPDQTWAEIIGIAGDIRHNGLTSEPVPTVFLLHAQSPGYITSLVVRTAGDPAVQTAAIRHAIQDVDRTQAVSAIKTMDQYLEEALSRPRLYAALLGSFAVLAVILAIIGIYGLVAYTVSRRTHEIGIRMALGAARKDVFRDVLSQTVVLVGIGLGLGVIGAAGLSGLVSSLLFGVTASDPVTYLSAASIFLLAASLAAAVPALRAARVDPMVALRYE
jgi:putative ABC transport system permease protein